MTKKIYIIILILVVLTGVVLLQRDPVVVTSFEECAKYNPVAASWPAQCYHEGERFVQEIGNELEKTDLITIDTPRPLQKIESPLSITGKARGYWYFEASFPVTLVNEKGEVLVQHYAMAGDDWMTEAFVPFSTSIEFPQQDPGSKGLLILQKDNPSGLPEFDDQLEIPVTF